LNTALHCTAEKHKLQLFVARGKLVVGSETNNTHTCTEKRITDIDTVTWTHNKMKF